MMDLEAIKKRCEDALGDGPESDDAFEEVVGTDVPALLSLVEEQRAWFRRYREAGGFVTEGERIAGCALAGGGLAVSECTTHHICDCQAARIRALEAALEPLAVQGGEALKDYHDNTLLVQCVGCPPLLLRHARRAAEALRPAEREGGRP